MIYKGQKLSDNLTKSQRDMFKYMIDRGDSVSEIVKIYMLDDKVNRALREPDVEEKITYFFPFKLILISDKSTRFFL